MTNTLKVIDEAKRLLWVMEHKNIMLDIDTKDPILVQEIEALKKQKRLIDKNSDKVRSFQKTKIFKYNELIVDQKRPKDFTMTLLKHDLNQFEIRAVIINNIYEWNNSKYKDGYTNVDFSGFKEQREENLSGYIILHSVGIIYGFATACNEDDRKSAYKISQIVENIIYDTYKF